MCVVCVQKRWQVVQDCTFCGPMSETKQEQWSSAAGRIDGCSTAQTPEAVPALPAITFPASETHAALGPWRLPLRRGEFRKDRF